MNVAQRPCAESSAVATLPCPPPSPKHRGDFWPVARVYPREVSDGQVPVGPSGEQLGVSCLAGEVRSGYPWRFTAARRDPSTARKKPVPYRAITSDPMPENVDICDISTEIVSRAADTDSGGNPTGPGSTALMTFPATPIPAGKAHLVRWQRRNDQ